MPQAIIRIAKIKTKGAAQGKTKHNYRLMDTLNADPERTATLNQELVNTDRLDYWSLAEARIEEGIAKTARGKPRTVREDQVRAVEIVLTASPDWFKRGEDRQAEDVRGSQWVTDNLDFLKNKYGEKNVVSFTLHQDETTPHIHAVVIPLTEKGRLSADTLFNPETLTQLQTDYAQAMAPHGLERGVEGSRRQHQDMKQVYGRQEQTAAELGPLTQPVATMPTQAVQLGEVPMFGREAWREQELARINADLVRQVQEANQRTEEANKRAQEAMQYAVANAGSRKQAEVLSRQLNVSEGLKSTTQSKLSKAEDEKIKLAMNLAQGKPAPESLLKLGTEQREQDRLETKKAFEVHLVKGVYSDIKTYMKGLEEQGFKFRNPTEDNPNQIRHPKHGSEFTYVETRPNGRKSGEQVTEHVQARRDAREKIELEASQAKTRRIEEAQQKVAKYELSLMDQAFSIYRWKVGPEDLTACLIVPKEKVEQVQNALRIDGKSYAAHLGVQGEPHRTDGQQTVYVRYEASFAHQVGEYLDKVRAGGGQVYEHAGSQTRREQLQAQPQQKIQEREQGPALTTDRERD